jgi:hypothetical protein
VSAFHAAAINYSRPKNYRGRRFIYVFVETFVASTNLKGMRRALQIDGCHEAREIAAMRAKLLQCTRTLLVAASPLPWTVEDIGADGADQSIDPS